jgi:hypothetical protein
MEDDYYGIIDPPSSFAPLEEWERFERDTLRHMNPNWPMTKHLYACLQKRRERGDVNRGRSRPSTWCNFVDGLRA